MMRAAILLCVSLAAPAAAWAEDAAPFVTQLRLPARGAAIDVMAWRDGQNIEVARADLERLDIVLPENAVERVVLGDVPGLSYEESASEAAIILRCTSACLTLQVIEDPVVERRIDRATGAYVNYDLDVQWLEGREAIASSVAEAAAFGRWGLIESSWVGISDDTITRLETRWTIDDPARRLRYRIGDATMISAADTPLRFAGVQVGRHFGLEPSFVTYPTALLGGEATSASTVELYVDGALRAREQVAAGPFVFDNAPLVSGGGNAQVVVTDVAGRQQIISRPFFVSSALLRPGLSDWVVSLGAERLNFGTENATYSDSFASARYRRGLTRNFTADAAIDMSEDLSTAQAGFAFADVRIGKVRVTHTRGGEGGASALSWFQDRDAWSFGMQTDMRDEGFRALGIGESDLQRSFAGHVNVELGAFGSAALTAASVEFFDEEDARTVTLSYAPRLAETSVTARLIYTDREQSELAFSVSLTTSLNGDVSAGLGYDEDSRGPRYRASLQRAPDYEGGLGWRLRASDGRRSFVEGAASLRGRFGDSAAQIVRSEGVFGARIGHTGSFGLIDGRIFAAPAIRGGFALIDTGAADVGVLRDRFPAGVTGADGRTVIVGLRPYDANIIAIRTDDLPFDQTPAQSEIVVMPSEGAGVVVRFDQETERLIETRVAYTNLTPPMRGAVLVRQRDGARFPVGANGRIVLRGARAGDVVRLDIDARCTARADQAAAAQELVLECAAA